MEEGANRSPSRDPLTPEPQDPAPKKKKKKRAATIGNNLFPSEQRGELRQTMSSYECCHVVLVTSLGTRVCADGVRGQSCGVEAPPTTRDTIIPCEL